MILHTIAAKLKQHSQAAFKGQHYEMPLIVQAISWDLRYPLGAVAASGVGCPGS